MSMIPKGDRLGAAIIVVDAIGATLAVIAVSLRLWARRIQRSNLGPSDYSIIIALFFALALVISTILTVYWGLGEDATAVNPARVQLLLKGMITGQILWICSNTMVRVSILLLYIHIFRTPTFRIVCYGALQLNVTYFIAVMVQTFLICQPFSFNWDQNSPGGSCGDQKVADRSIGVLNLIFDFMLVVLPLPMVWNLQMPSSKKIALSAIFGMGIGICIITCLRVWWIEKIDFNNTTKSFALVGLYAILEPLLGIVNACLPLLRPVFQKTSFNFLIDWTRKTLGSMIPKRWHAGKRHQSWDEHKAGLSDGAEQFPSYDSEAYPLAKVKDSVGKKGTSSLKGERLGSHDDMHGITVEREWVVQFSGNNEA